MKTLDSKSLGLACIVAPLPSDRVLQLAAEELALTIHLMTGVMLPTVYQRPGKGFSFLLTDVANTLTTSRRLPELSEDAIELRRIDDHALLLRGGGLCGVLYAVYEFLELQGCRWFHTDASHIPERKTLTIPQHHRSAPGFQSREMLWHTASSDPIWASRNRLNGGVFDKPLHGGTWGWQPHTHTFYSIVPPAKYGRTHPEYFSFRQGQGRVTSGAQLCLSNPHVVKLAVKFALDNMQNPSVRIVDISPNDCINPCQCPRCRKIDEAAGSHAGSLISFLNQIASATSKIHPNKFIGTLAYTYTQSPPRGIRPHSNIAVRLCHMAPSCDAHPLKNCPKNKHYLRCLRGWRKLGARVFIWHYTTNFLHNFSFFPNFDALAKDIPLYHQMGVTGLLMQAQDKPGLSFGQMHAYAQARLLWNPKRNYWHECKEFAETWYGHAAHAIMKLLEVLHQHARNGQHVHLYTHPSQGTFTEAQLKAADRWIRTAQKAVAKDPARKNRVAQVRLWFNYTKLTSIKPIERRANSFQIHAAKNATKLLEYCQRESRRLGYTFIREYPVRHQDLRRELGWSTRKRTLPLATLENQHLRVQVCPELAGMICTCLDKVTGHDLCCQPAPWMLRYPTMGGMTDSPTADGFGAGFTEPYKLIHHNQTEVMLRADTSEGIRIERRIRLHANQASFTIESKYTNTTKQTVTLQPHEFILLKLGALGDMQFFRDADHGRTQLLKTVYPSDGTVEQAQWVNLSGQQVPSGNWGLFNHKMGVGFIEIFTKQYPIFCGSNAYAHDQRVLLETMLTPQKCIAGSIACYERNYRVIHQSPVTRPSSHRHHRIESIA